MCRGELQSHRSESGMIHPWVSRLNHWFCWQSFVVVVVAAALEYLFFVNVPLRQSIAGRIFWPPWPQSDQCPTPAPVSTRSLRVGSVGVPYPSRMSR